MNLKRKKWLKNDESSLSLQISLIKGQRYTILLGWTSHSQQLWIPSLALLFFLLLSLPAENIKYLKSPLHCIHPILFL